MAGWQEMEERDAEETRKAQKVQSLIDYCFGFGQAGWNEAEDRPQYMTKAYQQAKALGLI